MGTFIPNTKEEQLKMLNEIGYADFENELEQSVGGRQCPERLGFRTVHDDVGNGTECRRMSPYEHCRQVAVQSLF